MKNREDSFNSEFNVVRVTQIKSVGESDPASDNESSTDSPVDENLKNTSYKIHPFWALLALFIATWLMIYMVSYHILGIFPLHEEDQAYIFNQLKTPIKVVRDNQNTIKTENTPPTINTLKDSLDDVQLGRQLFNGKIAYINGGPGCITCHQVVDDSLSSGGLIAPELTNVFSRLDEQSLLMIIRFPYNLNMQQAYQDKQVTDNEAMVLLTFFKNAANNSVIQQKRDERAAGFLNRIKKKNQ